jgi:hypothetical protein
LRLSYGAANGTKYLLTLSLEGANRPNSGKAVFLQIADDAQESREPIIRNGFHVLSIKAPSDLVDGYSFI